MTTAQHIRLAQRRIRRDGRMASVSSCFGVDRLAPFALNSAKDAMDASHQGCDRECNVIEIRERLRM